MRTPPFLARRILERLGADDEALIGDLVEEYRRGRSRAWYWAQVLSSVAMRSRHGVATNPGGALAALAAGWMLLLAFFFALGNPVVIALATRVFGWNRQWTNSGGFEVWWPFDVAATRSRLLGVMMTSGLRQGRST